MADQHEYRAYLLRLWQARDVDGIHWRASLDDPRTGIRLGFSSISRLYEFLRDQTDEARRQGELPCARAGQCTTPGDSPAG